MCSKIKNNGLTGSLGKELNYAYMAVESIMDGRVQGDGFSNLEDERIFNGDSGDVEAVVEFLNGPPSPGVLVTNVVRKIRSLVQPPR